MIDIYHVAKKRPTKKRTLSLNLLFKYLFGGIILIFVIYFGLVYTNQAVDNWLKLKPIKIETETTTNRSKQSTKTADNTSDSQVESAQLIDSAKKDSDSLQPEANPPIEAASPNQEQVQEIDKSAIKIKVLNGNAIYGAAARVRDILVKDSFKVESIGNAENRSYSQSIIYFKTAKNAEADLVKTTLENNKYQVKTEENSDLVGQNDLLVVVGKL